MAQFKKHFTLQEAQALIPWVQSVLEKVRLILRSNQAGKPSMKPATGKPGTGNGNGGKKAADASHTQTGRPEELIACLDSTEKRKLAHELIQSILDRGIVIQDVERGLIDFPAWKDDREVLLCYELADGAQIQYWHELTAGFAGRRNIEDWGEEL